ILIAPERMVALRWYLYYVPPIPLLYFLFKNEFAPSSRKEPLLMLISVSAALVALLAIYEWIFRHNPVYEYLVHNEYYRQYLGMHRAMSTQFAPANLAAYLVMCFPLSLYLALDGSSRKIKACGGFFGLIIFFGVISTLSRAAVFALFLSSAVLLGSRGRRVIIIVGGLVILVTLFSLLPSRYGFYRLSLRGFIQRSPYSARLQRAEVVKAMVEKHPFLGVGGGYYKEVYPQYAIAVPYNDRTPDNSFLIALAETGWIGFASFAAFLVSLFLKARRAFFKIPQASAHILCFVSCLVALLPMMFVYDALYWTVPLFLFWSWCGALASFDNIRLSRFAA
ncbi:MAG: O-antigen ligase family protein, partial [Candidatus Omnitrophota bacterium]